MKFSERNSRERKRECVSLLEENNEEKNGLLGIQMLKRADK